MKHPPITPATFRWRQPSRAVSALMLFRRVVRRWPFITGFVVGLNVGIVRGCDPKPAPGCIVLAGPGETQGE